MRQELAKQLQGSEEKIRNVHIRRNKQKKPSDMLIVDPGVIQE
jgi:hypothetical protein